MHEIILASHSLLYNKKKLINLAIKPTNTGEIFGLIEEWRRRQVKNDARLIEHLKSRNYRRS